MGAESLNHGPELLQDLHARLISGLQGGGIPVKQADELALSITRDLAREWGGQNIYFPKGKSIAVYERAWKLFNDFRGDNHAELAKKYNITVQQVYEILRECRKKHTLRTQHSMFDVE